MSIRMHLSLGDRTVNVRWPDCPDRFAVERNLRRLAEAVRHNVDPRADVLGWVEGLPERLHLKLVGYGLVEPRAVVRSILLADLRDRIDEWWPDAAQNTRRLHRNALSKLLLLLDPSKRVRDVDVTDARKVERGLKALNLASSTVQTHVRHLHGQFSKAVEHGFARINPFDSIPRAAVAFDESKRRYISITDVHALIRLNDSLLVPLALARGAGLRVPSEVETVVVGHIDAGQGIISVREKKTKRRSDRPIDAWAVDLLRRAGLLDGPDHEPVWRSGRHNLHKRLHAAIDVLELPAMERPFDGMRRCRERDLLDRGIDAVQAAKWTGHSPAVSAKHYGVTSPETWNRARGMTHQPTHGVAISTNLEGSQRSASGGLANPETAVSSLGNHENRPFPSSPPARIRTGNQAIMSRLL
jgi:hypothetical protein